MNSVGKKFLGALFALWMCGCASASAQSPTATPPAQESQALSVDCTDVNRELRLTDKDNLNDVTETRDLISAESARLEQKISQLNAQITTAPTAAQLASRRKEREELLAKPKKGDDDLRRIDELDDADVKSREELREEVKTTEAALATKKRQERCVRQAINSIYSPEQTFKRTMSITFAALIGLVISGFFVLSYVDESVRRAIFSGQTGIQFLTLFSIVIAIILFGITSILGDKELAALLGGLSGYILGRYGSPSRGGAAPADAAPDPAQASHAQVGA